jgi:hypothetical protein
MLLAIDLSSSLWVEAVVSVTYIMNRSPIRALKRGQTSFKLFNGFKSSIHHICVFGYVAYNKIPT